MKKINELNFALNAKSIMLFEEITGKSFYEVSDDDLLDLIYAIIEVNNPSERYTKRSIENVIKNNKKIGQQIIENLTAELKYISSFESKAETPAKEGKSADADNVKLGDIISNLIINSNMDPHYVLYEMEIWELAVYARAVERKKKEEMTDKRFWTYLSILPHIDGKKVGGPEKLLPFEWEETEKTKAEKFMEDNTANINNFFKTQNDGQHI